ncbi:hypothetical protein FRB99_001526, partial [Tulasnella sp. 403]
MNIKLPSRRMPITKGRSASFSATSSRRPRCPAFLSKHPLVHRSFLNTTKRPTHVQDQSQHTEKPEFPTFSTPALLPASLEPLDLSPSQYSISNLRNAFLFSLSEWEGRLSDLDGLPSTHIADILTEGVALVREGLEFLEWLKSEVGAHIPDLEFDFDFESGLDNALEGVRSHLPDFPDVASHLPDFDMKSRFRQVGMSLEDARARLGHLDLSLPSLPNPQEYTATLRGRLSAIRERLADISLPSPGTFAFPSIPTAQDLSNLIPDILTDAAEDDAASNARKLGQRAREITHALKMSCHGLQLIRYDDLPHKWKNNEYIHYGYRFIPSSSWKALLLSVFMLHNETFNIHTHLIPLVSIIALALPSMSLSPLFPIDIPLTSSVPVPSLFSWDSLAVVDVLPRYMFIVAAGACLACSALWHLSSGCADPWVLETGARTDYVGIGWLISASVATTVYYGFGCNPTLMMAYIGLTIMTGIAGSIAPFQTWFDERKNKMKRIAFFLTLAGASVVPVLHMGFIKGPSGALDFVAPVVPSVASYLIGLTFYATHFPECVFP